MCFDFDDFFDFEIEDFALIGGTIGYIEEELEEEKRRRQEGDDIFDPADDDPYP